MIKHFKNIPNGIKKRVACYENTGVIHTDNQPNYAYINANKANLEKVTEAFMTNPESVKFFNNFCYVGNTCYNGITKEMVIKAIM